MYVWIWRHLPGGRLAKALASLVLIAAVAALLFFVVFPRVQDRLPFNHVTIDQGSSQTTNGLRSVTGTELSCVSHFVRVSDAGC